VVTTKGSLHLDGFSQLAGVLERTYCISNCNYKSCIPFKVKQWTESVYSPNY